MPTATQSTTLMTRPARSLTEGPTAVPFAYNTGATTASSSTQIQLCKIPVGAIITDLWVLASSGAATNPADVGITGTGLHNGVSGVAGTASTFLSAGTGGAIARATKGLTWQVQISDDATTRFATLYATVTPGTATVSLQISGCVTYEMGEP
jgi:hypothetical protein